MKGELNNLYVISRGSYMLTFSDSDTMVNARILR